MKTKIQKKGGIFYSAFNNSLLSTLLAIMTL